MSVRGRRNILTGQVVSDKMDKTISVSIYNIVKHPKYKKYIKRNAVFKVHDEENKAKTGDKVRIFETRALSKTKRWKLLDLVSSGGQEDIDLSAQDEKLFQKIRGKDQAEDKPSKTEENDSKPEEDKD